MFISGMGFFTDAYDLFVIGIVVSLLKPEWNLSTSQVSWLNSSTLLASAVGAIVFGRVADMLGRKRIYGYEVLILAIGALASAFAPNYVFLLVCRVVLGIGIGGDYPVSATIMSEYSGKRDRGKMVGLVFAMPRCSTTHWCSWPSSPSSPCPGTSSRSCCSIRPGAEVSRCSALA
jgi:MFS transporter, PHS family, inorganic phosphate transporter